MDTVHTASVVSSPSIVPTKKSPRLQPPSAVVGDLTQKKTSDPFKNHLMLSVISNEATKDNQRSPAAISSAARRKYYEDKEQIKNEKKKAMRNIKLEQIEKKEAKKILRQTLTVGKTAPKRKKKLHLVKVTQETGDAESEKENLPAEWSEQNVLNVMMY